MTHTYKPSTKLQLDVVRRGREDERIVFHPRIIEAKWTRNHHLVADELTVTIGWKEGGIDPRLLKNARCGFWLWDDNREILDDAKHLRFTGVTKKIERRLMDVGWVVDLTFHDYTTLFIGNKPLKTSGMPEWSDTLAEAWVKICDNTGAQDPANEKKILSSVTGLRRNLRFLAEGVSSRTVGEMETQRFHAISKPTPKQGASSWDVWQWVTTSLGLISYIDKDECIVTQSTEHYSTANAPRAIYGHNIHSLEEGVDTDITSKGILMKSFDPDRGCLIEAFYPKPGDERLKARRAAVKPKSEGGVTVTENEQSADYEEFTNWAIRDQESLDRAAKEAYEERSRQEMKGSFKTAEMLLPSRGGDDLDIFSIRPGEALVLELDPEKDPNIRDTLLRLGSEDARVRFLVDRLDYDEDVARVIARGIEDDALNSVVFHIESIELDLGPERFEVEVKYHNLINIK